MTLPESMYSYRAEEKKAKVIDQCQECGKDIFEGYEYFDIKGLVICDDCINHFKGGD